LEKQRLEQQQKALYEQRVNGRSSGAMGSPDRRFPEQMDMPSGFRKDTTGRFPGQMNVPSGFRRDTSNRGSQQIRRSTDRGS